MEITIFDIISKAVDGQIVHYLSLQLSNGENIEMQVSEGWLRTIKERIDMRLTPNAQVLYKSEYSQFSY